MSTPNEIDYVEFAVSDIAATKRFYGAVFGWQFTDYAPTYAGIHGGGGEMGGFCETADAAANAGGGTLAVIYTEDLEGALARVQDAGGTITQDIFSFPGGRRFEFAAPGGSRAAVWAAT